MSSGKSPGIVPEKEYETCKLSKLYSIGLNERMPFLSHTVI